MSLRGYWTPVGFFDHRCLRPMSHAERYIAQQLLGQTDQWGRLSVTEESMQAFADAIVATDEEVASVIRQMLTGNRPLLITYNNGRTALVAGWDKQQQAYFLQRRGSPAHPEPPVEIWRAARCDRRCKKNTSGDITEGLPGWYPDATPVTPVYDGAPQVNQGSPEVIPGANGTKSPTVNKNSNLPGFRQGTPAKPGVRRDTPSSCVQLEQELELEQHTPTECVSSAPGGADTHTLARDDSGDDEFAERWSIQPPTPRPTIPLSCQTAFAAWCDVAAQRCKGELDASAIAARWSPSVIAAAAAHGESAVASGLRQHCSTTSGWSRTSAAWSYATRCIESAASKDQLDRDPATQQARAAALALSHPTNDGDLPPVEYLDGVAS